MKKIDSFRDEYFFLSNFYSCPIIYDGIKYSNAECAFQAQKTTDIEMREEFATLKPEKGKKLGRKVRLRDNWDTLKFPIMYEIVKAKFEQNPNLAKKLIKTGDAILEEGNNWGDTIWGTVNGVGQNHLGKILMKVREELKKKK